MRSLEVSVLLLLALSAPTTRAQDALPQGVDARSWREAEKEIGTFRYDKANLEIKLFANSEQIHDPAALCFDDQNRVYLCETMRWRRGVDDNRQRLFWFLDDVSCMTVEDRLKMYEKWQSKYPLSYYTEHSERVVRLEDRDGDGRADSRVVFADGFKDALDGPAIGLIAREGKVWLTCIPHLWELEDTDGDGVADKRRSIQRGFGVRVSLSGHDMHGLAWGPDGRLYWSIGDRGYNITTKEGRHFAAPPSGAVFRCEPDGSDIQVFHTGLRNPQELAFDQHGNLFTVDNNADLGDKARVVYVMEGGHTGWHSGFQNLTTFRSQAGLESGNLVPWMEEKVWQTNRPDRPAYALPPLDGFVINGQNKVSGPSGVVFHSTGAMGDGLANAFYVCDFRGRATSSGIFTFKVVNDGAGFRVVEHEEFIGGIATPDIDFSYDGRFYIADWAGSWTGNNRGNVYTVEHRTGRTQPYVKETAALFRRGFRAQATARLGELLAHDDLRVRLRAQFELARRGDEGGAVLLAAAREGEGVLARLHGIWGVGQRGRERPELVAPLVELLEDDEPEVRANTLRALGDAGYAAAGKAIEARLSDDSARVRAAAATALGALRAEAALPGLLGLLAKNADRDPFLRHAAVFAIERIGKREFVYANLEHEAAAVRLGLLLVLRRWKDPKVAELLDAADRTVFEAAVRAIHDDGIDAEAALAATLPRLTDDHSPLTHQRVLNANFRLGRTENAARLLAYCGKRLGKHAKGRIEAMQLLSLWGAPPKVDRVLGLVRAYPGTRDDVAAVVRATLPRLLAGVEGTVAAKAVDLASKYSVELDPDVLVGVVQNRGMQTDFRVSSLQGLARSRPAALVPHLEALVRDKKPEIRAAALTAALRIDAERGRAWRLAFLRSDDVDDRRTAYGLLDAATDDEAAALLVARLEELPAGGGQKESQLELVEAAAQSTHPDVVAAHTAYVKARGTDPEAPFKVALYGGEKERGKDVFQNHGIAQCVRCHRLDDKPSAGPGLRGVGEKSREYLLRSLISPSADIAPGFGVVMVETKDGEEVAGVLTASDATTLTLKVDEKVQKIAKADIKSQSTPISAMVPMGAILEPREVRDVIEFLRSLQPPKNKRRARQDAAGHGGTGKR